MIYFFIGDGQLCNQLFQFCFLKTFLKNKKYFLISSNFTELSNLINLKKDANHLIIKNKILKFFFRRFIYYVLKFLAEVKIIHSLDVEKEIYKGSIIEKNIIIERKGFFNICFVYPRYFQNESFFESKIFENLEFFPHHKENANNFLNKIPKEFEPVFVHIRTSNIFDEYKKFKIFGITGVHLPFEFYFHHIEWFNKNLKSPYFIFLSDDIKFVKKKFRFIKNAIFSDASIFTDLLIISKCNYGIMTCSSVSWWGGYMNKNKKKIFAPKYWLGWKSKITMQYDGEPREVDLIDPNRFIVN